MHRLTAIAIALLLTATLTAQTAAKRSHKRVAKPTAKVTEPAPAPAPQPPPPPPTLGQQSPVAPRVTYSGGLLTIDAPNSQMSDILTGVRRSLGIAIDGANVANQRVIVHLGPGRPRDVLETLLAGSSFGYVILASKTRPDMVDRVMLFPGTSTTPNAAVQNARTMPQRPQPAPQPVVTNNNDDSGDDVPLSDEDTSGEGGGAPEQPAQEAPPQQAQPAQPDQAQQQQQGDQNSQNNGPKTPEQLYKELQQLEQQRQQNQQNQQNQPQQPTTPR